MSDMMNARQLELELQALFGETSSQLECKPCQGKYRGHTDYALVFGSGRRLYVGLDQRNYLPKLREHLESIRHFRTHQAENTEKIKAALAARDTPFCDAAADILPYDGTSDLTIYAVVLLTMSYGIRLVYRTTNMHYYLVGCTADWCSFDVCIAHLLADACGKMSYTRILI